MKKVSIIGIMLAILVLPIVAARETVNPGVTPDSFLWNIETTWDNLNLFLTFNPAEKAKKGIELSRERLQEVKAMAEQNNFGAAEKAKKEELNLLSKVKASISSITEGNATKQIEEEIEVEKELADQENEINDVSSSLKIKIETDAALSEQQKESLSSLLSALENKTGEVQVEIENKKGETKIKIKSETNKSDKEIEYEIEGIEKEKGVADIKKEKAVEEINDAKSDLEELKNNMQVSQSEGNATNETAITTLVDNAMEKLSNAEAALNDTKYGEAFGQANAAKQLIESAKKMIERNAEKMNEESDNGDNGRAMEGKEHGEIKNETEKAAEKNGTENIESERKQEENKTMGGSDGTDSRAANREEENRSSRY